MPEPDIELLAAALRRDSADLDLYAQVLTVTLADSLPPGAVHVKRRRSVADRVSGREGTVTDVDITLADQHLALRVERAQVAAEIRKEVRGVVLSRRQVGLDEWIDALARAIAAAASSNARAREAVERFLG